VSPVVTGAWRWKETCTKKKSEEEHRENSHSGSGERRSLGNKKKRGKVGRNSPKYKLDKRLVQNTSRYKLDVKNDLEPTGPESEPLKSQGS